MRAFVIAATVATLAAMPAQAAESSYRAVISVLTTKGTFTRDTIATTRAGVSRTECELRKDVWLEEHGPMFESAVAQLKAQGQRAAFTVECERKE